MANNKCKECGCSCRRCVSSDHDHDVHLHVEIENLKQKLVERESHIVMMETNFLNEANKFPSGEMVAVREELLTWQDKYRRLYDAHRRIQRVNQGLEDKLLKLVDSCETDKTALTRDVAVLSQKLAEANYVVKKLSEDNERYKKDVSLAIQFLQCKQTNFVAHKFDSLPEEVQAQVSSFVSTGCGKRKPDVVEKKVVYEMKSIKVPIPTFPPTAMVYSIPKSPKLDHHQRHQQQQQMTVVRPNDDVESAAPNNHQVDIVSAAIMAKVLEERQKERAYTKHCDTCTCSQKLRLIHNTATHHSAGTQTDDVDFIGFGTEPPGSGGGGFQSFNLPTTTTMAQNQNSSSTGAMRIVRNSELKTTSSNSSSNIHNQSSLRSGCMDDAHNVAKVQPNNFLAIVDEDGSKGEDEEEEEEEEPLLRPNDDSNTSAANVVASVQPPEGNTMSSSKDVDRQTYGHHHHYLCSEVVAASQSCTDLGESTTSGDETSAKNGSSDRDLKGPRYCSVRVQSGTRNILLDNVHNSTAPVLYTRHHKLRTEDTPTTHECHHLPDSTITTTTTTSSSRDPPSRRNNNSQSPAGDSPAQHKQRVADWLRNNPDNNNDGGGVSSSDNSRSDPTAPIEGHIGGGGGVANVTAMTGGVTSSSVSSSCVDASRLKYAEMEENVKRFLFGESEFLKTVEIGKLRYKAYRAGGGKGKGGNREGFSEVGAMQEQAKATI